MVRWQSAMCCGGDHKITEDYYNDKEKALHMELQKGRPQDTTEIGRASCRERV